MFKKQLSYSAICADHLHNPTQQTITLTEPLKNTYHASVAGDTVYATSQIILVPQYTNISLSGDAQLIATQWNASPFVGGVLVFKANGTVALKDTTQIQVNTMGFRGGQACAWRNCIAQQGESFLGPGKFSTNSNGGGGGGGLYNDIHYPYKFNGFGNGGSAGHATPGILWPALYGETTPPGPGGTGGSAYGSQERLLMGSGGGGASRVSGSICPPKAGGAGGGIILIYATHMLLNDQSVIQAHGGDGIKSGWTPGLPEAYCSNNMSGTGSGGSIALKTSTPIEDESRITALGGQVEQFTSIKVTPYNNDAAQTQVEKTTQTIRTSSGRVTLEILNQEPTSPEKTD